MPAAPKANPPIRTLLGPGPSPVSPRVLAALALPVVGHLDPKFLEIMDQSMAMLRELFQTKNRLALPMSGTGSAGMETCFVNLIEPGDRVLIGVNGVFGTRMVDVAQRCGAQVDTVDAEWGSALDAQKVQRTRWRKTNTNWSPWCMPKLRPACSSRWTTSPNWCATAARCCWSMP